MPIELWLGFVAATAVLVITPGPTVLTVISCSIAYGRRASIPLVAGVAVGDVTSISLSILGLGALMTASAALFNIVKWVGGLYMIYLGIRLFLPSERTSADINISTQESPWTFFRKTYIVTAFNPRGIAFFLAFLPQFVSPNANIARQLLILAITFVILATSNAALYSLFAVTASQKLTSSGAQRFFNYAGGIILIIAAIWALLAKQPA